MDCFTGISGYSCPVLEGGWLALTEATIQGLPKKTNEHIKAVVCGGSSGGDPFERDPGTPIVLDLVGNGFSFTDWSGGVNFDLDADGEGEWTSWTRWGVDDSFLVLDRNGNGLIDSGAELFGGATWQPPSNEPNGFIARAVLDGLDWGGNQDGFISPADAPTRSFACGEMGITTASPRHRRSCLSASRVSRGSICASSLLAVGIATATYSVGPRGSISGVTIGFPRWT